MLTVSCLLLGPQAQVHLSLYSQVGGADHRGSPHTTAPQDPKSPMVSGSSSHLSLGHGWGVGWGRSSQVGGADGDFLYTNPQSGLTGPVAGSVGLGGPVPRGQFSWGQ